MNFIPDLKGINVKSKNFKLAASFFIPFVLFFILSPGVVFEINPSDKSVSTENKIKYVPAIIHSLIFSAIMALVYYFYLGKVVEHGSI